jgi:acyl dehydratase
MKAIDTTLAPVTRRAIVQYAGIVQDFNPVHYDDAFARAAGLPGIIAQGPLTFTLVLDALIAAHGLEQVGGLRCRLKAPVVPGDALRVRCTEAGEVQVDSAGSPRAVATLVPRN